MIKVPIPWAIWTAVVYHIIVSIQIPLMGNRLLGAGAAGLGWLDAIVPHEAFSALIFGVAILAGVGLVTEGKLSRKRTLVLVMPQYCFVLISAFYAIGVIYGGEYRGIGVERSTSIPILELFIIVAIAHTGSILERYWLRWSLYFPLQDS